MKIGTKSVLFGAHCFFIHPFFVALAWWKLFDFPWDPRLWVAFFVHDLGYWGKPNMDGEEGERHPEWGARVMTLLFDRRTFPGHARQIAPDGSSTPWLGPWGRFTYFHSRFLAKRFAAPFSRLCVADKLAVALEPAWLYLPRVIATGEIREYMSLAGVMNPTSKYAGEPKTKYEHMQLDLSSRRAWFANMVEYMTAWVEEHRDGRADTWTPDVSAGKREVEDIGRRQARDASGVWR